MILEARIVTCIEKFTASAENVTHIYIVCITSSKISSKSDEDWILKFSRAKTYLY